MSVYLTFSLRTVSVHSPRWKLHIWNKYHYKCSETYVLLPSICTRHRFRGPATDRGSFLLERLEQRPTGPGSSHETTQRHHRWLPGHRKGPEYCPPEDCRSVSLLVNNCPPVSTCMNYEFKGQKTRQLILLISTNSQPLLCVFLLNWLACGRVCVFVLEKNAIRINQYPVFPQNISGVSSTFLSLFCLTWCLLLFPLLPVCLTGSCDVCLLSSPPPLSRVLFTQSLQL